MNENTTPSTNENIDKAATSNGVRQNNSSKTDSKKKPLVIAVACLVGIIIMAGAVYVLTKKHPSTYHAAVDDHMQQISDQAALNTAVLPFKNTIKSDGLLYATVNGQDYPTEFTSWGGHSLPHAGGHVEGNNKSNFRIHIEPSDKIVNMATGGSVCSVTDLCGITAANARASAPWYTAENSGMKLIAVEKLASQNLSSYIPGEGMQLRLFFSFDGGLDLNLQHVGEISPELLQLIHTSGQDSALVATQYTKLAKPVEVSKGMALARPQIISVQSKVIGGQMIYQADAQTEWSITPTMVKSKDIACQWNYFSDTLKKQLQAAMDTELTHPNPNGLFSGAGKSGSTGVEGAAEGTLCASATIAYDNYSKISSDNSFGYYQINDAIKASGEVMAVYPINKASVAYQANKAAYASSSVDFMFRRGTDVSGFADTSHFSFNLAQGAKTYTMHDLSGEVIDMPAATDTVTHDHFTVRIDRGDNGASVASMPIGKYVGVRYIIEKDKVVAQYSDLADTAAAVKLPDVIADTATCGGVYVCYIHDFSLLKQ
jgi:hypothetical protein